MKTVNELWQQSQNDAEGMRLGYTTQQHYFAALVRADEREACEALCKWRTGIQQVDAAIETCEAAIRARGNT